MAGTHPHEDAGLLLPLERYAAVLAHVLHFGADRTAAVVQRFALTVEGWESADAAWSAELSRAASAPVDARSSEFVGHLFRHRAELARTRPSLDDAMRASVEVATTPGLHDAVARPSSEPWMHDFLPPWSPIAAPSSGAHGAPSSGGLSARLSVAEHANLCAELFLKVDEVDRLLARHRVSQDEKRALDAHYRRLLASNERVQSEWQLAFDRRRQELVAAASVRKGQR